MSQYSLSLGQTVKVIGPDGASIFNPISSVSLETSTVSSQTEAVGKLTLDAAGNMVISLEIPQPVGLDADGNIISAYAGDASNATAIPTGSPAGTAGTKLADWVKTIEGAVQADELANAELSVNGTAVELGSALANRSTQLMYDTVSAATTATIPAAVVFTTVGAWASASERAPMNFRRVSAEPVHAAKFQSKDQFLPDGTVDATNGGWWELCSSYISPEMLADRPMGYKVGTDGFATAPDDTDILNNTFTAAIELNIPVIISGKWYRHNSPLSAAPLTGITYEGASVNPNVINYWSTINAKSFVIIGYGNPGFIAGAAMDAQFTIEAAANLGDGAQPQWCRIYGVKFNGNNLATGQNLMLLWSANVHILNCGFANAATGIGFYGYGVFLIEHCDIGASDICIDMQRAGDSTIRDCDIFVQHVGARIAGNVKFVCNTLTGTNIVSGSEPKIGCLINPVGEAGGADFPYTYGVLIEGNEFFIFDTCVYGDATSSGFDAIHMVSIVNNHIISNYANHPDTTIANLTAARNIFIAGNRINRDVEAVTRTESIILKNCEALHITGNDFTNVANTAIDLTDCNNVLCTGNTFTNVGMTGNVLYQTENLSETPWVATNLSVSATQMTVPTNTLVCPNGATLTKILDTSTDGVHQLGQPVTVVENQAYVMTAIVSAAELTKCKLCPHDETAGAVFDLTAGTVVSQDTGCVGNITELVTGIYRVWCSLASMPDTQANPSMFLVNSAGTDSYAGTGQGLYAGAFLFYPGYTAGSYDGANTTTLNNGSCIVLTDSSTNTISGNTYIQKYTAPFPNFFVTEVGTSDSNTILSNVVPDRINPVYRVGQSTYVTTWEKSAFRAVLPTNQSVDSGAVAALNFTSVTLNRGNKFSGGVYTPGMTNIHVSVSISITGGVAGDAIQLFVYKNGSALYGATKALAAASDGLSVSFEDEAGYGDTYQAYLYNGSSGSLTISDDARFTFFSGNAA